MKHRFEDACALGLLCFISLLSPVQAQTAATPTRTTGPYTYHLSEEVTLSGTVSSVLPHSTAGMIMGSHLLLATATGPVDASLGRFALMGKGALPVAAGQQVEVTGVMKTIKANHVFLVRTVKAGGTVYPIRNQHGFAISPQGRQRTSQKMTQKSESL
jgi:hypothetical protein